ncbi:S-layer homology domain-containing protein [Metasolibacillus sp.]
MGERNACSRGIIQGYEDRTFRPNETHVAVLLTRACTRNR